MLDLSFEEYDTTITYEEKLYEQEQFTIKAKDKINNKRKKHINDTKPSPRYKCTCERCQNNGLHKHKRAERVYTEEEDFNDVYIDVGEGYWCVYDYNLGCHVAEEKDRFVPCDMFPTEDDWLDEIGCGHLCEGVWKEYVDHTGRCLSITSLEPKEDLTCSMCGTAGWCECF